MEVEHLPIEESWYLIYDSILKYYYLINILLIEGWGVASSFGWDHLAGCKVPQPELVPRPSILPAHTVPHCRLTP